MSRAAGMRCFEQAPNSSASSNAMGTFCRRSSHKRPLTSRQATTKHQQALVSRLTGQPCLTYQAGRTIIPLLMPQQDSMPFAVAIEVLDANCTDPILPTDVATDMYELQHVLSGTGMVKDQSGEYQTVSTGDSLLLQYGAAALFPIPAASNSSTNVTHPSTHPLQPEPLVALKVLIPAAVLHDTPDQLSSRQAASSVVSAWGSPASSPTLSDESASHILSMASASIRSVTNPSHTHPTPSPQTHHKPSRLKPLHSPSPPVPSSKRHSPHSTPSNSSPPSRMLSPLPSLPRFLTQSLNRLSHLSSSLLHLLPSHHPSFLSAPPTSLVEKRSMQDLLAFQLPNQTNKLALAFGPDDVGLRLSFGVEIFQPGHRTPPHVHNSAHELFFVLLGEGDAFCNGQRFGVSQGDCVVFPPQSVHGIDNLGADRKLYCLQIMLPNEMFVEFVKSGKAVGRLDDEDLCNLIAVGCSSL